MTRESSQLLALSSELVRVGTIRTAWRKILAAGTGRVGGEADQALQPAVWFGSFARRLRVAVAGLGGTYDSGGKIAKRLRDFQGILQGDGAAAVDGWTDGGKLVGHLPEQFAIGG